MRWIGPAYLCSAAGPPGLGHFRKRRGEAGDGERTQTGATRAAGHRLHNGAVSQAPLRLTQAVHAPADSAPATAETVRSPAGAPAPSPLVQAPGFAERSSPGAVTARDLPVGQHVARTGLVGPLALRQVATTPEIAVTSAPLPPRVQRPAAANGGNGASNLVVVGIAAAGAIALLALLLHRRQATPEIPQWTRSPSYADTRSISELSVSPGTLPQTLSHAGATTSQRGADGARRNSAPSSRFGSAGATPSRTKPAAVDPSTIDTLLDAIDSDIVEERAVREAWAAARSDVEREMDGNAILQAIEEAERDLHLAPPLPAQAAIERALEDDLLQPRQRR